MSDTQLVPLSAAPDRDVARALIAYKEQRLAPAVAIHMDASAIKRELNQMYEKAWNAKIIDALHVLVHREGVFEKESGRIIWQGVVDQLRVDAWLDLTSNTIEIKINGDVKVNTAILGQEIFIPGRGWLDALLDLFEAGGRREVREAQRKETAEKRTLLNLLGD